MCEGLPKASRAFSRDVLALCSFVAQVHYVVVHVVPNSWARSQSWACCSRLLRGDRSRRLDLGVLSFTSKARMRVFAEDFFGPSTSLCES